VDRLVDVLRIAISARSSADGSSGPIGDLCILFTPPQESLQSLLAENVAVTVVAGEVIADNR